MKANIPMSRAAQNYSAWEIWARWTIITSLGEFAGFTIPAITGAVTAAALANVNNIAANLTMAIVMIVSGAGEGALLGLAQWLVLRHYLPQLTLRDWIGATMMGAIVAWAVGMLPTTAGDPTALSPVILILGGLILGPTLLCSIGFTQYWILKRYVHHAAWWVPASAFAWFLGLVVVFTGMALVPDHASVPLIAFISSLAGFGMGAVAAGVSGSAIVWLLHRERRR